MTANPKHMTANNALPGFSRSYHGAASDIRAASSKTTAHAQILPEQVDSYRRHR